MVHLFDVSRAILAWRVRQCSGLVTLWSSWEDMVASDDQSHKAVCGGFLIFFAIVMTLLATIYLANHASLLVDGLKLLPDNPGWNWFFGWTILLAANTTLGLPIWSALFIVSGLVFGQRLSLLTAKLQEQTSAFQSQRYDGSCLNASMQKLFPDFDSN